MKYSGRYTIGDFIKNIRKQRGLTQADLADIGMDEATLSRLERGETKLPTNAKIRPLLERLGINPYSDLNLILDDQQEKLRKQQVALESAIEEVELDKVKALIAELENEPDYTKYLYNTQYLAYARIILSAYDTSDPMAICEQASAAIRMTIVHYQEEHIPSYLLSDTETRLINLIAGMYFRAGEPERAISVMYLVKANFEKRVIDQSERGRRYPKMMYHLAKYLTIVGRYQEAIELCDEVVQICRYTGYVRYVPFILSNKVVSLYELGDKESALEIIRWCYTTYKMYGMYDDMKDTETYAQATFGADWRKS